MNLGETLTKARGAGVLWAEKTGVQRFFTIAGPVIYIAWGVLLVVGAVVAGILGAAFDQNKRR